MSRLASIPLAAALVLTLAAAGPQRHDSAAPIDFGADHIELQDKANRAILTGSVSVRQAEMTINAERMTVAYTGQIVDGSPQVSRLDATGGVRITRPDQTATSNFAVYDLNRRTILLLGDVVVSQDGNVTRSERLTLDLDANRTSLSGGTGGRVTGTFSVPKRDSQ